MVRAMPAAPLPRQHRLALGAVLLAVALVTLDSTLVNTALPAIGRDLQASPAQTVWLVNAYQLAVVAGLLPFAALADRFGARRVHLAGLAAWMLAALASALAGSIPTLAAARAAQGLAAGAMMSVNIALVRTIMPADQLGRGMGLNALVVGTGFAAGPGIASLVLAVAPWPWLFGVTLPLALLSLLAAWPHLPRPQRRGAPVDPLAAALTALGFACLVGGISAAAQRQSLLLVAPLLATAVLALALLLKRQAGQAAPMLPVDLLKRPLFALSIATAVSAFCAQGLAFVGLPFYFETVLHRDAVQTGFLMAPWAIVVALAAPVAGPLSDRHPPALMGGIGLALLACGLVAMATVPADAGALRIVAGMALCGLGFGLFQSPNLRAIMSAAPPERNGSASGMVAMARLNGQALGAAGVALCFSLAGPQGPVWALWLGVGAAALGALASALRLRVG